MPRLSRDEARGFGMPPSGMGSGDPVSSDVLDEV